MNDKKGRILILEVTIDDTEYLLINICNANAEQHQLETLQNLSILLENFDNFCDNLLVTLISFSIKSSNVKKEDQFLKSNQ